jgi:hypothetical protein
MKTRILILAAAALAAAPAAAQESSTPIRDALLAAIRLPEATREARELGVPERDIRTMLTTARERRLPVGVMTEVIVTQNTAVREHGPVENFGAFVQSKLDQGLRGRELAAAIRAEHAARGIGRGKRLGMPGAAGAGLDRAREATGGAREVGPGAEGRPGAAPGRSDPPGKPDKAGKPDAPGRPEGAGRTEATPAQGQKPELPGRSGEKGAGNAGKKGGS